MSFLIKQSDWSKIQKATSFFIEGRKQKFTKNTTFLTKFSVLFSTNKITAYGQ